MTRFVFFVLKSLVFLLLSLTCCLSMPPKGESVQSVKRRLAREQRIRRILRVRQLLQPRVRLEDTEILVDSEEENRLVERRARGNRDQPTQTDSSFLSFCCGVFVSVFMTVCLVCCLISGSGNDSHRITK
jgi:hypothetical protein